MKSFQGHSVKWAEIGSSWNSSLGPSSSWMIVKLIRWCFLPKGNLRLILWSLGSLWWPQISQNKLTSALFLRTNEKKHTVVQASRLSFVGVYDELLGSIYDVLTIDSLVWKWWNWKRRGVSCCLKWRKREKLNYLLRE